MTAAGYRTIESKISRLEDNHADDGVTIHFADDTPPVTVAVIAYKPPTKLATPFAELLGLELTPAGDIKTGMLGGTSLPGVYAAGDAAFWAKAASQAFATGMIAGAGVAHDLIHDDLGLPPLKL